MSNIIIYIVICKQTISCVMQPHMFPNTCASSSPALGSPLLQITRARACSLVPTRRPHSAHMSADHMSLFKPSRHPSPTTIGPGAPPIVLYVWVVGEGLV